MMSKFRHKATSLHLVPRITQSDYGTTLLKDIHKSSKTTRARSDPSASRLMVRCYFLVAMINNWGWPMFQIENSSFLSKRTIIGLEHVLSVLIQDWLPLDLKIELLSFGISHLESSSTLSKIMTKASTLSSSIQTELVLPVDPKIRASRFGISEVKD